MRSISASPNTLMEQKYHYPAVDHLRFRTSMPSNRLFTCLLPFLFFAVTTVAQDERKRFATPFEQSDGWETVKYQAAIRFYQDLSSKSPRVTISERGSTDSGLPLHLVLIADGEPVDLRKIRTDERSVLLINNAIHPGESDGVDASMAFARDLALNEREASHVLSDVIVAIIPVYNIGGALNRNKGTRANQNGPREYGFRGNGRNYDLNRDFIKCDTRNARSFTQIFQMLDPDLLIDTHVSNGADYQHVMTTSQSQKDKLGLHLGTYLEEVFEPKLFDRMKRSGFPTIPYVNSGGRPPEQGFSQFLETPRYSTGYAALFQTMGFMTETHMLKPYPQRVKATQEFLRQAVELLATESKVIQEIKQKDRQAYPRQPQAAIAWEVDQNMPSRLEFHGYHAEYIDSEITPGKRLFYDRDKPFVRNIPYFNHYRVSRSVSLPAGYLIPREWHSVIELMQLNLVEMQVVEQVMQCKAEVYQIDEVETRSTPYEGHYFHDKVKLSVKVQDIRARPGDMIITIDQDRARYVVETLEPAAMDSLFRWNRFDTILQQKEHFSPYVFETSAHEMLNSDPKLKQDLTKQIEQDAQFATDRNAQLEFLYRRSIHYEKSHRRYPVVRLLHLPK